jgi:hypothetical protein
VAADDNRSGGDGTAPTSSLAGAGGPMRLALLGLVILVAAIAARWVEDVAAPFVNEGEADMAHTVALEADGGDYRIVTSGPARPDIHNTVCRIRTSDGEVDEDRGADGIDGGHERLGVTRVVELSIKAGRAEVTCGNSRPTGGEGLGRFQVVEADGLLTRGVTIALGIGAACLLGGLLWLAGVVLRRRRTV